ncbi:hypothetical protein [Phormidesmis sp. 146-33]
MQEYLSHAQSKQVELERVDYDYADGKTLLIAEGYEHQHDCSMPVDATESAKKHDATSKV